MLVYGISSLGNIYLFLASVPCSHLGCLDRTTALVRLVLHPMQSSAPRLAAAEAEPMEKVTVIWQSFGVRLSNCRSTFPCFRSTLSLTLHSDSSALLKAWFVNHSLQSFVVRWVLNKLVIIPIPCGVASATWLDKLTFLKHFLSVEVTFVVFWK